MLEQLFNVDKLMTALPIMGKGMLGIFVVTGVIILVVALLNKATQEK
ncbi:MAG: oxaloacetate decarboxylase [Clostridia bacterium]|nr:oxaloacetate decarboxylase [Clostridia bacterium]